MSQDVDFAEYVAARRPHLYRSAWMLCGDPCLAEDLVQEALTKLYVAWPRVSRVGNMDAYVRRVLVNGHIDNTRRPWRRERSTAQPPETAAAPKPVEDAEDLWLALRALPAGQRRVVVLRHYWGLSIEEVADDLGVSTGTVKSQSSAALAALRRCLIPETAGAISSTSGGAR